MSEKMPQSEVDKIFASMTLDDQLITTTHREPSNQQNELFDQAENEIVDPGELYQHLVANSYSDEEIESIFDLIKDEKGDIHEV